MARGKVNKWSFNRNYAVLLSSFHYYGQIFICASSGVQHSEEALRFKHVDRNTWMLLTDENHVTHYCMHAKTLTKMTL